MTFECSLSFDGEPPLHQIVTRLATRGLLPREIRADGAVLAFRETAEEQLVRWGGDVEISVTSDGLFVAITVGAARTILADIVDELAACGFSAKVAEL